MKNPKRTEKLQSTATAEEVAEFRSACEMVGLHPAETLRKLAGQFVEQIREKKSVRLPLRIELK